jgi:cell division protein FtsA
MDAPEIVVGLDIGTTKIACIVGRKTENGKIEILGMGKSPSVGVTRGVVSNIEKTVHSIRTAVEEAEAKSGIEINVVNVGIAGQHIKSLQHRGMITRNNSDTEIGQQDIDSLIEDMYKLVMMPGEEIIHVLPQEYIIDRQSGIKDPIGMAGVQLEANFHIITGQIAAAKNIYKCVAKAGLEVAELILEPLASSSAVLSEEEKEAGVVLVDIGGGTTDVAIFHDGIIRHTAVIPFGGNVITEDIKEGCTIMHRQAELMKTKFGTAFPHGSQENEIVCIPGLRGRDPKEISIKNLSSIINARITEMIEHVYYEIKNSGYEKKLIGGIVITGGGSQLKHITQLSEYITGMDTRIGYPSEHLSSNSNINVTSPLFATGVGLVAKGFEEFEKYKATQGVNTRTHSEKTQGSFFKKVLSFFDDNIE